MIKLSVRQTYFLHGLNSFWWVRNHILCREVPQPCLCNLWGSINVQLRSCTASCWSQSSLCFISKLSLNKDTSYRLHRPSASFSCFAWGRHTRPEGVMRNGTPKPHWNAAKILHRSGRRCFTDPHKFFLVFITKKWLNFDLQCSSLFWLDTSNSYITKYF